MVVAHMSQGLSFESFGAEIDVHRDTLYEWASKHDAFSDAMKRGQAKSQLFYEKLLITGAMGKLKNFNAASVMFAMKNRFRWRSEPLPDDGPKDENRPLLDAMAALDREERAAPAAPVPPAKPDPSSEGQA